jgi:hypothetical protein
MLINLSSRLVVVSNADARAARPPKLAQTKAGTLDSSRSFFAAPSSFGTGSANMTHGLSVSRLFTDNIAG